ncbi:MAG: hypothetical protein GX643_07125 [Acidimicrobiales bacterium]|nr:hypothetical protein [Acidimicrobiales bacterium]
MPEDRETEPTSRGALRILGAVAVCLVALAGLAVWVLAVGHPGEVTYESLACDMEMDAQDALDGSAAADRDARCEAAGEQLSESEDERLRTALIAGAVVVTVAFAASTWPSRRLTGEELGPIR